MAGAADIPAFRSMRTLRALRPLRAVSRWEGMRVSKAPQKMLKTKVFFVVQLMRAFENNMLVYVLSLTLSSINNKLSVLDFSLNVNLCV